MHRDDWAELERVDPGGAPTVGADPGVMSLWFSTKGRISRSTYWLKFVLPMACIQIGGAILDIGFGLAGPETMGPATVMTSLLVVWPGIVGLVKRLHDLDLPGSYVAAYYGGLITGALLLAIAIPVFGEGALILGIPLIFLVLMACWYGIKICFFPGTAGPNRYGPDPVGALEGWE